MRRFSCERCSQPIDFAATRCPSCDAESGYDARRGFVRELLPTAVPAAFTLHDSGRLHWRCLAASSGCNGIVLAHTPAVWCAACALTRGRPDLRRTGAVNAWTAAEGATRRVLHELDQLGLRYAPRSLGEPHGLAFDFVPLPGVGGVTGSLDGVVTLDLAEVDDPHRDARRCRSGERSRSVLGHLRHELGHYFHGPLVRDARAVHEFRAVFGDERSDHAALREHHRDTPDDWDTDRFVSASATSHPLEDWAETFAAYLELLDLVGTAAAHGLLDDADAGRRSGRADQIDLAAVRVAWRDLSPALAALHASTGAPSAFPGDLPDGAMSKLSLVHELAVRHVGAIDHAVEPADR